MNFGGKNIPVRNGQPYPRHSRPATQFSDGTVVKHTFWVTCRYNPVSGERILDAGPPEV
jgi:hypothetical protein